MASSYATLAIPAFIDHLAHAVSSTVRPQEEMALEQRDFGQQVVTVSSLLAMASNLIATVCVREQVSRKAVEVWELRNCFCHCTWEPLLHTGSRTTLILQEFWWVFNGPTF